MKVMVKRCPFCGKSPMVLPLDPMKEGDAWGEVRCVTPDCPAKPSVRDGVRGSDSRGSGAYKLAAIKRWNSRNNRSPSPRFYTIDDIYTLDISRRKEARKTQPVRIYIPEKVAVEEPVAEGRPAKFRVYIPEKAVKKKKGESASKILVRGLHKALSELEAGKWDGVKED